MLKPLIELRDIKKFYDDRCILNGINFRVYDGDAISITGESGSDKSTLLNIMALFEKPDFGDYLIDGVAIRNCNNRNTASIRNRMFGFVFQSYNLIHGLSAKENILVPLDYTVNISKDQEDYFETIVNALSISHLLNIDVKNLSGGEKQRVAIARAIINKPKIVFADEPTGNLDGKIKDEVLYLFDKINKEFNIAIIMVTHDKSVAFRMKVHYRLKGGLLL